MGKSVVAAGGLAVTPYLAQMIVGLGMPTWAFWTTTSVGAAATLLTVWLANRRVGTAAEAAEAATARQRRAFEDALVPLTLNLQQIVSARGLERTRLQQQVKLAIVSLAANLLGTDRTRACFLELSDTTPGQRELRCLNQVWAGGTVPPSTPFRETEPLGRRMLEQLDTGRSVFVEDIGRLRPRLRPQGAPRYRTFISSPVKAGDTSYGILAVDCPEPGDLSKDDVTMVEVFARMLSVALAVGR
jgi:GAF domain-containing protein